MNMRIPIHKLSAQAGLTSRALRHWESEGLFQSTRDKDSGWRVYDETAILSIRITALLRRLDIPIKEIKTVFDSKNYNCLLDVVNRQISFLKTCNKENANKEKRLIQFLSSFEKFKNREIADNNLSELLADIESAGYLESYSESYSEFEKEDFIVSNLSNLSNAQIINNSLQFITLPPMRAAGNAAVGVSPEDEAMSPVLEWIDFAGLAGTAKLLGGNMPPMPSGNGKPYGYGMCAAVPEDVTIPEHLKEIRLPGGIYARLESTDDIPASWKRLTAMLKNDEKYTADRSRLCFEEHIRDDKGGFIIVLLEPVKEKQ